MATRLLANPLPRARIKSLCETVLVRGGVSDLLRSLRPGASMILAYHNVVEDGWRGGDRSLHLERSRFREQLDHLLQGYRVVGLDTLLDPAAPGDRPRVAITFDDAYRGALELGVEDLCARDFPATFFVSPGLLGGSSFWWDILAQGGAGADHIRQHAVEDLQGDTGAIRQWARGAQLRLGRLPSFARCVTLAGLVRAGGNPGITVAPHGWSHRNLTRLEGDELRQELERPLEWLRARFRSVIPWLAYPYGRWDARVEEACGEAGYEGAVCVGGGRGPLGARAARRFALPRISVPAGLSLKGFILRTSGVVPG